MIEEPLAGGIANAGLVVRAGDHVLRPSSERTSAIHALFRHVRAAGFDGVPEPVGVDPDGRERLVYIDGDVAVTPFPGWAQSDEALASIARLLRRYHDAASGFVAPPGTTWSDEMADPAPGSSPVLCHNDVCLENVVFRDGEAVALLDFDFAAPGRPVHDLACMVRMCAPVDAAADAARWGWRPVDVAQRLRLAADAYGLDAAGRAALLDVLAGSVARGGEFLARRIAAGEQAFIDMVAAGGGLARFDRRRAWFAAERERLATALA